ncbi:hypothetical protein BH24ACI3_BH24ACI3_08460 [soil metagenome]
MFQLQGCGSAPANDNTAAEPIAQPIRTLPFATKEPDEYQATFVVRAGGVETLTFVARKGANRRTDHRVGAVEQLNVIETDKAFRILPGKRVYTAQEFGSGLPPDRPFAGFTDQLLNVRLGASFENTGTENGLTVFRVTFEDSPGSQSLIYVSPELGMPIKQEFYSVTGGQRTLMSVVELRDVTTSVDDAIFRVPDGFKLVTAAEFEKIAAQ